MKLSPAEMEPLAEEPLRSWLLRICFNLRQQARDSPLGDYRKGRSVPINQ
jgi:hypothetical protein